MKSLEKIKGQRLTQSLLLSGLMAVLLFITAACGPAAPEVSEPEEQSSSEVDVTNEPSNDETSTSEESSSPTPVQEAAGEEAYPPPPPTIEFPAADSYPVDPPPPTPFPSPTPASYPAVEDVFSEPRFRLNQPLASGNATVSGQAPPDLPLAIVDITFNGIVLGTGVSDGDGNFTINVSELPAGHRIGITFSQLQAGKTLVDMSEEYFSHRGEGFMNLPNVGIYFDTAMVDE